MTDPRSLTLVRSSRHLRDELRHKLSQLAADTASVQNRIAADTRQLNDLRASADALIAAITRLDADALSAEAFAVPAPEANREVA